MITASIDPRGRSGRASIQSALRSVIPGGRLVVGKWSYPIQIEMVF